MKVENEGGKLRLKMKVENSGWVAAIFHLNRVVAFSVVSKSLIRPTLVLRGGLSIYESQSTI